MSGDERLLRLVEERDDAHDRGTEGGADHRDQPEQADGDGEHRGVRDADDAHHDVGQHRVERRDGDLADGVGPDPPHDLLRQRLDAGAAGGGHHRVGRVLDAGERGEEVQGQHEDREDLEDAVEHRAPGAEDAAEHPLEERWSDILAVELGLHLVDDVVALVDLAQPAAVEGVLDVARAPAGRAGRPARRPGGMTRKPMSTKTTSSAAEDEGHGRRRAASRGATSRSTIGLRARARKNDDDEHGERGREPADELPQADREQRAGGAEEADVERRVPVQRPADDAVGGAGARMPPAPSPGGGRAVRRGRVGPTAPRRSAVPPAGGPRRRRGVAGGSARAVRRRPSAWAAMRLLSSSASSCRRRNSPQRVTGPTASTRPRRTSAATP